MRPSKRPRRINLSVTNEVYDTIERMAELSEMSISACLAEMLEDLLPGIKDTVTLMETARELDAHAKKQLGRALEPHEQKLRQAVAHAQDAIKDEVKQHNLPL